MHAGHLIGRESELARISGCLVQRDGPRALVVAGDPGIGKTTLWEAGLDAARASGFRVLAARPSEQEVQLSFVALADLLQGIGTTELAGVPAPQLRALEVALLRVEPGEDPPESSAVLAGFATALRVLAAAQPVLLAIDDVTWLDGASADVLAFAARRLADSPARFLLARRPGKRSQLEQAFGAGTLEQIEVGPLSLGAVRTLLAQRLGLEVGRHALRRIVESTGGNPLFALEVGRVLVERGLTDFDADLALPDALDEVFRPRVEGLPDSLREPLLAVALSGELRLTELIAVCDDTSVADAVDAGLIVTDGLRVRPSHPLLAAAAKRCSRPRERRRFHAELARLVANESLAASHLAMATAAPDARVATTLAAAAATAFARGATFDAVGLAEHALRLTAEDARERPERVLALAEYLSWAGEATRMTELLDQHLAALPRGAARTRAYLLLADMTTRASEMEHYLDRAVSETDDPALRATALATQAGFRAVIRLERLGEAEATALEASRLVGLEADPWVPYALAWTRILRGTSIDDLRSPAPAESYLSLERLRAVRLGFRGESEARGIFHQLLSLREQRGEQSWSPLQQQLLDLELRFGHVHAASRILADLETPLTEESAIPARCEALLAALRGLADEAERAATAAIAACEVSGARWNLLEAQRAQGIAALLTDDPRRAADSLRAVWEHTVSEGIDDPGAFPVAPDLVESLVAVGELEEARAVTDRLELLSIEQRHPWGLASSERCRSLINLASRADDQEAAARLAAAAAAYGALDLHFDEARSLLALGRAQRRCRRRAAARHSLERAAAVFEELGASGWAEHARSQLARVASRRPAPAGTLTSTEERVALLAADGLSNKEIAARLVISVHTVEKHLSHVYAKLGVRSRGQLAARLPAATTS